MSTLRKLDRDDLLPAPPDELHPTPSLADMSEPSRPSPARALQATLQQRLETPPETERWPGAVRVAIIFGGSALVWAGLISGFRALARI